MFCSNCGASYTEAPTYCKSCGSHLRASDLKASHEKYSRQMLNAGISALALLLTVLWIFKFTVGHISSDGLGWFAVSLTLILVWMVTVVFVNPWYWARTHKEIQRARAEIDHESKSHPAAQLPPKSQVFGSSPSVTEQTTGILVREPSSKIGIKQSAGQQAEENEYPADAPRG